MYRPLNYFLILLLLAALAVQLALNGLADVGVIHLTGH